MVIWFYVNLSVGLWSWSFKSRVVEAERTLNLLNSAITAGVSVVVTL